MDSSGLASDTAAAPAIAPALLAWYDAHARTLPWRAPPGAPPPAAYRVWLSEVMLQQTTVAAVIPYFARFLARWPDVAALAAAPDGEVMAAWAGLGYYARARKLLECARAVAAAGGRFPDNEAALQALPGIGPYTAAAIAAIAFDRPATVVDGNVERVVSRLIALSAPLPAAKPTIRAATAAITPQQRPGDFAQAMMDLGATLCTPRSPSCLICPLGPHCAARAAGTPEAFPVKTPKPARPQRTGAAFWIERTAPDSTREVWLIRRPARGLLGGMRALPDDGWCASADGWTARADGTAPSAAAPIGHVRHVFTHFELTLRLVPQPLPPADPRLAMPPHPGEGAGHDDEAGWWPVARLSAAGLPAVFAKAAALASARESGTQDAG